MSRLDYVSDHSKEKLRQVPAAVLDMKNLKMLFLEGNFLRCLPGDFFWRLPNLVWLDLRNNLLESLPKSIANHENLENLLLTNNNLHKLPNELGLLPKLKALQIADNPLVYPMRQILIEGTKVIKNYLKEQHSREAISDDVSERVIRITEESSSSERVAADDESERPTGRRKGVPEAARQRLLDPRRLQPTLQVRQLSSGSTDKKRKKKREREQPVKIVHKVDRTNSKISLRSTVDRLGARASERSTDRGLREGWLHQIRILLNDQERILQQERNLRSLSSWRVNQKLSTSTPKVFRDDATAVKVEPPYATDPKYAKIPTRDELATQLHKFFKENNIMIAQESRHRDLNIDKLINDLMQQLKEMEGAQAGSGSPRTEIEMAGRQIKTVTDKIMNIQKKLLQLKSSNASTI